MKRTPLTQIVLLAIALSTMLALARTSGGSALAAEPPAEEALGLPNCASDPDNPTAETPAEDVRFTATHEQVATVAIPLGDAAATIHSFCLDRAGNLLATSGGEQLTFTRSDSAPELKLVNEPSAVHVISPDGKLRATWSLEVTPQAINVGLDGCVYCGGQGRLAKLDPNGKLLKVADAPHVAELPPLPLLEEQDDQEEITEEEKKAKIADLKERSQAVIAELLELAAQRGAEKDDEEALARVDADIEKVKTQYLLIAAQLRRLTTDSSSSAKQMRWAVARSAAMRKRTITGIAVTDKDVFVASPAAKGFGYDVWRTDLDLTQPKRIITGLRGCCGQMDIQAHV